MEFTSFKSLMGNYKAIFFDSYGVLKNYSGIIENAQQTLELARAQGIAVRVLTNDASRGPDQLCDSFHFMGLSGMVPSEIITSGMMAKDFIFNRKTPGKALYLGTPSSAEFIFNEDNAGISINDYDDEVHLDEIGSVVFLDDEGFEWRDSVNKVINLLRKKVVPVIVANSDLLYPVSRQDVSIATGSIAKLVENILGRRFIHFGKPDSNMFIFALQTLSTSHIISKKEILMVGDTLHTDILGGIKFGVDTALVCSGNTSKHEVHVAVEHSGIRPDYICDSIGE